MVKALIKSRLWNVKYIYIILIIVCGNIDRSIGGMKNQGEYSSKERLIINIGRTFKIV